MKNNKYNIFILIIFILSIVYSYPNLFGEDPVIIIENKTIENEKFINEKIENKLLKIKSYDIEDKHMILRFSSTEEQFNAFSILKSNENLKIHQNIIPSNKIKLLEKINAYPMKFGLDLRGGVHLVMQINTKKIIEKQITKTVKNIKKEFKTQNIIYENIKIKNKKIIQITFNETSKTINYSNILKNVTNNFNILHENKKVILKIKKNYKEDIKNNLITKTLSVLTNRINELGISETIIQRHGKNKITIDMPGIQNIEYAKNIIGKTATLNFMLLADKNKKKNAKIIDDPIFNKIILKNKSILSGNAIIYASAGFENTFKKPCVNIKIDEKTAKTFNVITKKNIGKPLAIIYSETFFKEKKEKKIEKIISIANIMTPLNENFQITGLTLQESKNLSLLLRAGSLPASISIIEEKIIGPSLGENNIITSIKALISSLIIIVLFLILKYKKLGIIASIALVNNILLLIAVTSIIGVTLTLSGIAGIILTIGMSIDSNILIFERIKEEGLINLDNKIIVENGFKNALSSITDANITTLIISIILFVLGAGPIKGFAITLSIGILTSIYSSLIVTKKIINIAIEKKIRII